MSRLRYIFAVCLLCYGVMVSAQTYEQMQRRHVWNGTDNVNYIRQDTLNRSYAQLTTGWEGGAFRDSWQPRRSWDTDMATASVRHLDNMSLMGSFSFQQSEYHDMCGSMFIQPGYFPVDVLEFTPGRKKLQQYSFEGGLSYAVSPSFNIGALMDFNSSNIAKYKDLRHSNYRLDMIVSPGFTYKEDEIVLGVNFTVRKVAETVEPEQIGVKQTTYDAFLDKGMMYGVYSAWTGSGLHLDEAGVKGLPVKELHKSIAFQLMYSDIFAEVEFGEISGTIGEKDYIWFTYPGNMMSGRAGYSYDAGHVVHHAHLEFGWKDIRLDESILEKVTEGGVTTVRNHGSNRILTESDWYIRPVYEYVSEKYDILASAEICGTSSTMSQMYPFVYKESLLGWSLGAEAKLYLDEFDLDFFDFTGFELDAGIRYSDGAVYDHEYIVAEDSGVQTKPFRLEEWYERQMEFRTAPCFSTGLAVRYNFMKGLYAEAEGRWIHAFNLNYIDGNNRFGATLGIGYNF